MKFKLVWEQNEYEIDTQDESNVLTPLTLLKQLGEKGREDMIEILSMNYRHELLEQYQELRNFESKFFGLPNP